LRTKTGLAKEISDSNEERNEKMNRRECLKTCTCGLCSYAAIGLIASTSAVGEETKPQEDWRFQFVKQRYAKLLTILAGRMDEKAVSEILEQQGRYCASQSVLIKKYKGDIDGFLEQKKKSGETITYDRAKGVITIAGPERSDCFCPLVDCRNTPKIHCNCSLGWNAYAFETMLGKKVKVELKESVLRGGKRCTFQVRVGDEPAQVLK
jgi:hypothetical protein